MSKFDKAFVEVRLYLPLLDVLSEDSELRHVLMTTHLPEGENSNDNA